MPNYKRLPIAIFLMVSLLASSCSQKANDTIADKVKATATSDCETLFSKDWPNFYEDGFSDEADPTFTTYKIHPSFAFNNISARREVGMNTDNCVAGRETESDIAYLGGTYGVAWGDWNNDNHIDLYLTHHSTKPGELLLNNDGVSFSPLKFDAKRNTNWDEHDASFVDIDGDGSLELFVTHGGGRGFASDDSDDMFKNKMFRKTGSDVAIARINSLDELVEFPLARGRTATWLDYDQDGDLDIILSASARRDMSNKTRFITNDSDEFSKADTSVNTYSTAALLSDFNGDRIMDVFLFRSDVGIIYGDGKRLEKHASELANHFKGGSNVATADFNNDGKFDLVMSDDRKTSELQQVSETVFRGDLRSSLDQPSTLSFRTFGVVQITFRGQDLKPRKETLPPYASYVSDSTLEVRESYADTLKQAKEYSIGKEISINRDKNGLIQLILHPHKNSTYSLPIMVKSTSIIDELYYDSNEVNDGYRGIRFLENTEGGFKYLGHLNSPSIPTSDLLFGDFDIDGDLDIYAGSSTNVSQYPNYFLKNDGLGQFELLLGNNFLPGPITGSQEGLSTADINNDGCLDILISSGGYQDKIVPDGTYALHVGHCPTENNWLGVKLKASSGNLSGIGSSVIVQTGNGRQIRFVDNGISYRKQNDTRLLFGLGSTDKIESITVYWWDGQTEIFQTNTINEYITLVRGEGDFQNQ